MNTVPLKKVTIISEAVLEPEILRMVKELGARGYTASQVRGEGSRGVRASEWEGPDSRIETLVSPEVAGAIVDHVATQYFEHYAVIVFVQDAEVVRGEKYI